MARVTHADELSWHQFFVHLILCVCAAVLGSCIIAVNATGYHAKSDAKSPCDDGADKQFLLMLVLIGVACAWFFVGLLHLAGLMTRIHHPHNTKHKDRYYNYTQIMFVVYGLMMVLALTGIATFVGEMAGDDASMGDSVGLNLLGGALLCKGLCGVALAILFVRHPHHTTASDIP